MTTKSSKKYGIILIVVFSLFILGTLALSDSSQNSVKPANNTDEPINIPISASIQKYTYADLNNRSDTILIGMVKEILPPKWNTVDGKRPNKPRSELIRENVIYTDIIINVDEYLRNPLSPKEVRVRVTGGTVGNDTMSTDYEPSFKAGEKVLLYLIEDTDPQIKDIGPEHFTVTGYMQGKFILTDDGQAIGDEETISQEVLLSKIKGSNNTVEQPNHPEVTSTDEPANIDVEESLTGSMSGLPITLNYTELSKCSDTIFIGTVKEILPSKWNSADGKRPEGVDSFSPENSIYTDITISVDEYLKNPSPSKEATVRVEGGKVGNDTLVSDSEPTFQPGEKVLLYLMKDDNPYTNDIGPEHFIVTGAFQGKFTLINGKLQDPLRILPPWMSW